MLYRNHGAPFTRADGSKWERDAVAHPTPDELKRRAYKLRAVIERASPPPRPVEGFDPGPKDEGVTGDVWPLRMTPKTYLKLHEDGPYAELAQRKVDEEKDEEADGNSDD